MHKIFMLLGVAFFVVSCARVENAPLSTPVCDHYIDAKIIINEPSKNPLYVTKGEILDALNKHCIRNSQSASNVLNVEYQTSQIVIKEDKIVSSRQQLSAKIDVVATLIASRSGKVSLSASTNFNASSRKILGIGPNVLVSRFDRNNLLDNVSSSIFRQLSSTLNSKASFKMNENKNDAKDLEDEKDTPESSEQNLEASQNSDNQEAQDSTDSLDPIDSSDLENEHDKEEPNSPIEGDNF